MGIFSLFGKKETKRRETKVPIAKEQTRASTTRNTTLGQFHDSSTEMTPAVIAQRHSARMTERKIDAIEHEMARDIVKSRSTPKKRILADAPVMPLHQHMTAEVAAGDFETTVPMAVPTDFLLGMHSEIFMSAMAELESIPTLDEAAILFANGQASVAEEMLISAIRADTLGPATDVAWQMLFDLYRINKNQHKFESLSLDYADKFETSPPLWSGDDSELQTAALSSGEAPTLSLPTKLDASIVKQLENLQTLSQVHQCVRFDFSAVRKVDPVGCGVLLRVLKNLKKNKRDFILIEAEEFSRCIQEILQVGRRDETEAPWLLQMEILQWLYKEQEFEQVALDYCVTFEVSPPAFEPPAMNAQTRLPIHGVSEIDTDRFKMPRELATNVDAVIKQITEQAKLHSPLILDCASLDRVDFSISARFMDGIAGIITSPNRQIRLENLNYLVLMLFTSIGMKGVANLTPRKHS